MTEHYDVILAGYGPVGQVAANLLGQRGFRVAAFDIATSIYNLPRAAHFDAEIMRVFQSIGLAEAVLPACAPVRGMHFLNAAGEKIFGFDAPDRLTAHGWPAGYLFYQPDLEKALQAGAYRFPTVEVFPGYEVISISQDAGGVTVRVRELSSGAEHEATADYLWGCDGARSLTRKTIGAELEDLVFDQPWLVIDTMLKRPVELPDVALQICDPERPTTFIPSAGDHRRWEFMLMPGDSPEAIVEPDAYWPLLSRWVSPDDTEVIRAVVYSFHALIAQRYRDRRIFIAGDAAHQMPPFLGQGMCAGIRDVVNLAWKLDLVRQGIAGDGVFDTYYSERAPHVRAIIQRAVMAGRIIQTTDPAVASARDEMFRNGNSDATIGDGAAARMPGIAAGILDPERASGAVGEMFPQPLVAHHGQPTRLDDLAPDFAIVAGMDAAAELITDEVRAAWSFLDPMFLVITDTDDPAGLPGHTVREHGDLLSGWLRENGAAVVRPDRYVYGTARSAEELVRLADALRAQLS